MSCTFRCTFFCCKQQLIGGLAAGDEMKGLVMKMLFQRISILTGALFLCMIHFTAAPAQTANSTLQTALKRGTIVVGTRTSALPFSFKDEKGELAGFDIDLARELARGLFKDPSKVEFVILSG